MNDASAPRISRRRADITVIVILPTNKQLLDPALDPRNKTATDLLVRWGRLHAARSALSSVAFVLFLVRLAL